MRTSRYFAVSTILMLASGELRVRAALQGKTGDMDVMVIPPGTYRLTGEVDESTAGVSDAIVDVIAGTGTGLSTVTDFYGRYRLSGHQFVLTRR